jgi:tRNA uridine 5-carboxymethylaminomethyl modification enzyme
VKHQENHFNIIIVGGGHAGVEAAYAAVKLKQKVALITLDISSVGRMSCNPAVGGIAKGQLVREMDVLGALMPRTTDDTGVQFKLLNLSKGRSVWSPRAQVDKRQYERCIKKVLFGLPGLKMVGGEVINLFLNKNKLSGVLLRSGETVFAPSVVLTCGTFLGGLVHVGEKKTQAGRMGEHRAVGITEALTSLGLRSGRLKTGTPPRLYSPSVDWGKTVAVFGDISPAPFSYSTKNFSPPNLPCHTIKTNQACHDIIQKNLSKSPMFSGDVSGVGPRYCPSIEDKIHRFVKKKSHLLFLEPEWVSSDQIYVNGFSTSLPEKTQLSALRKIPALKNVEFLRPGYAIEYDFFPPAQLKASLESKEIPGLFFAGQINGTSGYEEAAAQGLVAGVNASRYNKNQSPFVLGREEAYMGVLIDDLITKDTAEPYRMFTSRAEYRLLLRYSNADIRLLEKAKNFGLIKSAFYKSLNNKLQLTRQIVKGLGGSLSKEEVAGLFPGSKKKRVPQAAPAKNFLKRPEVSINSMPKRYFSVLENTVISPHWAQEVLFEVETQIKYEGYIKRQRNQVDRMLKQENVSIPPDIDYSKINTISLEAREKLQFVRPETLGQAFRVSGVTPADISVLSVLLYK